MSIGLRFISPIAAYRIVVIHEKREALADGTFNILAPGFTAEFKTGAEPWEHDLARTRFKFRNIKLNHDGTEIDPIGRVSSFDTASIVNQDGSDNKELREKVETLMLQNADFGNPEGYILAERPKVPAPWAAYDELLVQGQRTPEKVAQKNLETAEATGVPIDALISYERQNRNHARIIAEYERANTPEEVSEEELVEA